MCCTAADRIRRAGRRVPAEAEAAPVTADTRRHWAAEDDSERGAERHLAIAPDTTRHAGLGLQNRKLNKHEESWYFKDMPPEP